MIERRDELHVSSEEIECSSLGKGKFPEDDQVGRNIPFNP
jgi:hypothetical protein